jgi:hypothetical protein
MKIRRGFVSNSSSSSFCIFLPKEAYDKAYDESHPFVKACMDVVGFKSQLIKGNKMVCFGYSDGDSCIWEYESPDYEGEMPKDGEYELGPGDAVEKFEELAIKHAGKDNFMTMSIDT